MPSIDCPYCQTQLELPPEAIGRRVSCPTCGCKIETKHSDSGIILSVQSVPASSGNASGITQGMTIAERYVILQTLGRGGMGEVYLARCTSLNCLCALKVLQSNLDDVSGSALERFKREAMMMAKVRHPNAITIMDAFRETQLKIACIVMEYVDGENVEQMLERGPIPEKEALRIAHDVVQALIIAEDHKIVHRDIKPANIMLTSEGVVKLADLGIGKMRADVESAAPKTLTMDNSMVGTPAYASPEQLRSSNSVDVRSDIYSLGATLYHMLSGKQPHESDSVYELITKAVNEIPEPLHICAPNVSRDTEKLVNRMMAKNPDLRPQSMRELLYLMEHPTHSTFLDTSYYTFLFKSTFNPRMRFLLGVICGVIGLLFVLMLGVIFLKPILTDSSSSTPKSHLVSSSKRVTPPTSAAAISSEPIPDSAAKSPPEAPPKKLPPTVEVALRSNPKELRPKRVLFSEARMKLNEKNLKFKITPSIPLQMIYLEGRPFTMGATRREPEEHYRSAPPHEVTLNYNFYISKYEVSQALFEEVAGRNPSAVIHPKAPVTRVSYNDALVFCDLLNQRLDTEGKSSFKFRLPTEAEWEFACRAASETTYAYGDFLSTYQANYAWNPQNPKYSVLAPCGATMSNAWGIADMHGNVAEWCMDDYTPLTRIPATNPYWIRHSDRTKAVLRGGSYLNTAYDCSASRRFSFSKVETSPSVGIRLVYSDKFNSPDDAMVSYTQMRSGSNTYISKPEVTPQRNLPVRNPVPPPRNPPQSLPSNNTYPSALTSIPPTPKNYVANLPASQRFPIGNNQFLNFLKVPKGSFLMGNTPGSGTIPNEKRHKVTISRDFMMGQYEISAEEFKSIMGYVMDDPSCPWVVHEHPEQFYPHVCKFCHHLNERFANELPSGYEFRLPTEAEWEYVMRYGRDPKVNLPTDIADRSHLTAKGGAPNPLGIYSLSGGVREMVLDKYRADYENLPSVDPVCLEGEEPVIRGGRSLGLVSFTYHTPMYDKMNLYRFSIRGGLTQWLQHGAFCHRHYIGIRLVIAPMLSPLKTLNPNNSDKRAPAAQPRPTKDMNNLESFILGT